MKKLSVTFLAVLVFAVMSCVVINSEDTDTHKIHNHVHASVGWHWQCSQCGMQASTGANSYPSEFGCDTSNSGKHVWQRMYDGGSKAVNWQCIHCGMTTYTSSFPNEFGCSSSRSRRHVWQRT